MHLTMGLTLGGTQRRGLAKMRAGAPMYAMGDSIDDYAYSVHGHFFRTLGKLKQGIIVPPRGNRASAGSNSKFGVRDLPVLRKIWQAGGIGWQFIKYGTNPDGSAAETAANIEYLIDQALAFGHYVIWHIVPHTSGATAVAQLALYNSKYLGNPKVFMCRTDILITNTGAGDQSQGMTNDGTHYNDEGAEVAANLSRDIIIANSAPLSSIYAADVTSLIDGSFAGNAGTVGAGMSAKGGATEPGYPTGWGGSRLSGDGTGTVCVETEVMDGVAYRAVELTLTGGSAGSLYSMSRSLSGLTSPSVDDHLDAWFCWRILSGAPSQIVWQFDGAASGNVGGNGGWTMPRYTYQMVGRSYVRPRASSSTTIATQFIINVQAGVTLTIRLWAPRLVRRAVADYAPIPPTQASNANHPEITGTAQNGQTLTCQHKSTTWQGKPSTGFTVSYQWFSADNANDANTADYLFTGTCAALPAATAQTYTPVALAGKYVGCIVEVANSAGSNKFRCPAKLIAA